MTKRPLPPWILVVSLGTATTAALGATSASCSATSAGSDTAGSGAASTGTGSQSSSASGSTGDGPDITPHDGPFSDFPKDPIIEQGLPAGLPGIFTGAPGSATGGPCLTEPALDAMVPRNWTPLLFEWNAPPEQNVFELTLSVKNQTSPLVLYTSKPTFTIDSAMWKSLSAHSSGEDLQITVRGAHLEGEVLTQGPLTGASGAVHLAPVDAPGSVVYWTSTAGTSFQGFTIGDAKPVTVLTPAAAGDTSTGGKTTCVSCHTSSPDGKLVIYTRDTGDTTRAIDVRRVDGMGPPDPEDISAGALALLGRNKQSAPVLSAAHYSPADAVAISVFVDKALTNNRYELIWTDLHTKDTSGWGILPRKGDPRQAASPAWRHDGAAVAYVSAASVGEGVVANTSAGDPTMDIYTVPFNNRAGGPATPLAGASDPAYREFYPVYSPDDTLLAYNRTDKPVDSYNQPSAELLVVPGNGGTATRLQANDPPACTALKSPGLTNSWARWAPSAGQIGERKYYWLVFSSKRRAASADAKGNLLPQLYISSIVTTISGGVETIEKDYPALYVTSQIPTESNHTPAWDVFKVSDIPPK